MSLRNYLHIDLNSQTVKAVEQRGEELVRVGRYLIARTLVEENIAGVDPLAPDNPLIFSAGPFAGTNFSNANRTSVGCKTSVNGGRQGSQCRRHPGCCSRPVAPVGIYPARRVRRLGHYPSQERRQLQFRPCRRIHGQGQFRDGPRCCMINTAKKSAWPCAGPSANTRDCWPASPSAIPTGVLPGWRRAAASAPCWAARKSRRSWRT